MNKNKANILIETILSEKNLFPLAAKCAADAYAGLDETLKLCIRNLMFKKCFWGLLDGSRDFGEDYFDDSALSAWGHSDEKFLNAIINKLKDENPFIRELAAYALGKIASDKAVEPLIEALKDKHPPDRIKVYYPLFPIGLVVRVLKYDTARLRAAIVMALGSIGTENTIEPLIEVLRDEDDGIKLVAAEILGEISSEKAIKPLIEASEDEDPFIGMKAAEALRNIISEKAFEACQVSAQEYFTAYAIAKRDDWHNLIERHRKISGLYKLDEAILKQFRLWKHQHALDKIGPEKSVELLIDALRN